PFRQWLAGLNSQLHTGMRVMITTRHDAFPDRSRDRWNYDEHERIHPPRAELPLPNTAYVLKKRVRPGTFTFTYPRTEEVWDHGPDGRYGPRRPKSPASFTLHTTDPFVIPLDLVDVATMREYLAA